MAIADRIRTSVSQSERAASRPLPAISELGFLAEKVLLSESEGRIAAVFESSFYAVLGDRWICVGLPHLGSGPLHVLYERRPLCWPEIGAAIAVTGSTLRVDNKPFATFGDASIWRPELPASWTLAELQLGLSAVDESFRLGPAEEGLAAAGCVQRPVTFTPLIAAAAPGIAALDRVIMNALDGCAPSSMDSAELATLIGLGPGLTPSGDDLLGGALIALAELNLPTIRDLLWNSCRDHLHRTNDISAIHLRTAALGFGAAAMHAAIQATIKGDISRVEQALAAVSAIGHSSGRDGFAGALIALRAVGWHFAGNEERAPVFNI